jgi:hypothetical protein
VIVAGEQQDAAVPGAAGHVAVAQDVAGAVHAGALAVPQAKHAVILPLAAQLRLLRAPQRGGREILVEPRLKADVRFAQQFFGAHHLHVHRAQRRAAIARDIPGSIQPRRPVACLLHQHQPHQRLRAIEKNRRFLQIEAIVERNLLHRHVAPPFLRARSQYRVIIGHNL